MRANNKLQEVCTVHMHCILERVSMANGSRLNAFGCAPCCIILCYLNMYSYSIAHKQLNSEDASIAGKEEYVHVYHNQ